jgi:glutathione S-transferase
MTHLKLFHFPGGCSRVTMTALETAGCTYEDEMVNLMKGEHMQPAYRSQNPRGKIPALLVDGALLTENAAILTWIDAAYPQAKLFPDTDNAFDKAKQLSLLFWLSSVWHPSVRAMKMPMRWTMGDEAPVRERGRDLVNPLVEELEARLASGPWYFGETWSIIDVYFYWAYTTGESGGYDLSARPNINRHRSAVEALPAFQRALAREDAAKLRAAP